MRVMFGGSPGVPLITPGAVSPRGTFTRGSAAYLVDSGTGALVSYGSNVPRFDSRLGLLLEGQRQNLFSTSQNFAVDESISLAAATTYTLSFYGPGNIIITGPDVSGTLTGLGTGQRARLTFTTTTGGLTNFLPADDQVSYAQLETGFYASSYILTLVGPATRLADNLSWPLSALGIPSTGACTVWGELTLPQTAANANQFLIEVDDGTDSNRLHFFNTTGSTNFLGARILGGGGAVNTGFFPLTVNASTPFAFTVDGSGRLSLSVNGSAISAVTGGPSSGLTTLRVGNSAGGTREPYGYFRRLNFLPAVLPDAALPNLR